VPYPRAKPPAIGVKTPFPGFIAPALATSIEAERCFRGEEITWSSVMVILIIELKCLGVYDDRHK